MPTVGAASFSPAQDATGLEPFMVGDPESGRDLTAVFASLAQGPAAANTNGPGSIDIFPVAVGKSDFGNLAVARGGEVAARGDLSLLRTIATDLAVGLENLRLKEIERTDLQRYAQAVTVAQENERKRLARELHDGPAQSLIILSRSLSRIAANGPISETLAAEIVDMQETTRHTLDAIRRTSRALRPALLDDLGLVPALEALVERHDQRVDGTVEFTVTGQPRRLPPDAELAAFRVVQEALANVRRHAQAESTLVSLEFKADVVIATVADDGRGFDVHDLEGQGSLGVTGMRERAELVGAKLKLKTSPSGGTTVRLKVPV
jgi:signal transduction histidine kinase